MSELSDRLVELESRVDDAVKRCADECADHKKQNALLQARLDAGEGGDPKSNRPECDEDKDVLAAIGRIEAKLAAIPHEADSAPPPVSPDGKGKDKDKGKDADRSGPQSQPQRPAK